MTRKSETEWYAYVWRDSKGIIIDTGLAGVDVMRCGATGSAARGKKQKEAHEGPPVSGKGVELSSSLWLDNERF